MSELLKAPDVALTLISNLRTVCPFPAVKFGRGVAPNPRTQQMVMVVVDYGRRINVAQQEGVARVNVWHKDYQSALDVAQWCAAEMIRLADGKPIQRVDNQYGPTEVPEESGQMRLYLTADIIFRVEGVIA